MDEVQQFKGKASLISKSQRRKINASIFNEGVVVVPKFNLMEPHAQIDGVTNLQVSLATRSMLSRNMLDHTFNWGYHYYVLNNDGVEYLRNSLSLPAHVTPVTHQNKSGGKFGGQSRAPGGDRPQREQR